MISNRVMHLVIILTHVVMIIMIMTAEVTMIRISMQRRPRQTAGVCEKNTIRETWTRRYISFQQTQSGSGEQFMLLGCRDNAEFAH